MLVVLTTDVSVLPEGKYDNEGFLSVQDVVTFVNRYVNDKIVAYCNDDTLNVLGFEKTIPCLDKSEIQQSIKNDTEVLILIRVKNGFLQYRKDSSQLRLF